MCSTTIINNKTLFSQQLEVYRQSGDFCAFLNIDLAKFMFDRPDEQEIELAERFVAFERAGFHLSSNFLLEFLFPSILQQFAVARCAYELRLPIIHNPLHCLYMVTLADSVSITPKIIVPSYVAVLAILFNISLLIVTASKISLSTMCNWLIAFDSLCQIPALLPFLVNLFAVFSNIFYIDHRVCLTAHMVSAGSSYASFLAMFFISMERLLIVAMPMQMSQFSGKTIKRCSLLIFFACICFGFAMILHIFNFWTNTNKAMGRYIYCDTSFFWYALNVDHISLTILGLSLFNYVLIAGLICWRRMYVPGTRMDTNYNAAYSRATYRMLRSVLIISLILLFGWIFGSVLFVSFFGISVQLIHNIQLSSKAGAYIVNNSYTFMPALIFCIFPLAAGINAPVLIINNSDYRTAYKQTLASLLKCRRRRTTTSIGPLFINQ